MIGCTIDFCQALYSEVLATLHDRLTPQIG